MAGKFEKPSRFNFVSFFFFLILAGAVYAGVQFGPPYYRRWKAAGVVSEMVSKLFGDRHKGGDGSNEVQTRIRTELLAKLKEVGIDETTVQTNIRKAVSAVSIDITYREVVKHPVIDKTTTLEFTISEEAKHEKLQ